MKFAGPKVVEEAAQATPKCFPADTLISTETGLRPIQDVGIGDLVWAFNLSDGTWRLCPVLDTHESDHTQPLVELTIAGETVRATLGHPFWVIEGDDLASRPRRSHILKASTSSPIVPGRWVDSHDLKVGDVLLLRGTRPARITEISLCPFAGKVYNFAVDSLHCYAVGATQILVHNDCNFIPLEDVEKAAAERARYEALVKEAEAEYPKKALRPNEDHHIDPQYLTGNDSGPTVNLPAPYHQYITNEFRDLQPWKTGPVSAERLQQLNKEVYSKYPLPPFQGLSGGNP